MAQKISNLFFGLLFLMGSPLFSSEFSFKLDKERYFSGDEIRLVICSTCEDLGESIIEAKWTILGKDLKKIKTTFSEIKKKNKGFIPIDTPSPLRAVTPITIEVKALSPKDKNIIGQRTLKAQIFPTSSDYYVNSDFLKKKKLGIYDPLGRLKEELDQLNIQTTSVKLIDELETARFDLFLLGPESFLGLNQTAMQQIKQRISNGLRVVTFSQTLNQNLWPSDIHLEDSFVNVSSITFTKLKLPPEIIKPMRWGWGTSASSKIMVTSTGLTYQPIWQVPDHTLSDDSHKISLIGRFPRGEGENIICQIDFWRDFDHEPLARWFLARLIEEGLRSS